MRDQWKRFELSLWVIDILKTVSTEFLRTCLRNYHNIVCKRSRVFIFSDWPMKNMKRYLYNWFTSEKQYWRKQFRNLHNEVCIGSRVNNHWTDSWKCGYNLQYLIILNFPLVVIFQRSRNRLFEDFLITSMVLLKTKLF